jgi:hypothetical protein
MRITKNFLAPGAAIAVLAITPVALGSGGAKATATPSHVSQGKQVTVRVTGLKPKERTNETELIVSSGQKRVTHPRAGSTGIIVEYLKAQVAGRHTLTFVGRTSHRRATTQFVVK